jgi:anaerobic selenocysteine-containing dehydrogenase
MAAVAATEQVRTFCPLCVSRCGATATIEDGEFVALGPDPSHPTGQALCVKGKAAPDIVRHPDRLEQPLRRTNPKGADDPGWEPITWDEALRTIAKRLNAIKDRYGAEAVVFGSSSPSTTAISDSIDWLMRLRRAFGSPNHATYMELCGWGRYLASMYTWGAPVPGVFMPDLDRAGCILYWGYNPSVARLAHATSTVAALRRGARLVVVDPRRAGLATKADHWLRVRPGTDAAIALALTHVMLERGWYDDDFVRRWTDAPLLVRTDEQRLLRADEVFVDGDPAGFVAWDGTAGAPVAYDPATRNYEVGEDRLALIGEHRIKTLDGDVSCTPVFEQMARECRAMTPEIAEPITGVPASDIVEAARTIWASRPLAFYVWSGLEQQSNATQTIRAINQLYALTGCLDVPGGNVLFTPVPTNSIDGADLLPDEQRTNAVGMQTRPLGPARFEFVNGEDVWTAALDGDPYPVRAMVNFGANLTMAHGDSARVRDALRALELFVHVDLFMNPTAEQADIVLPATSAFEHEALRVGFEVSQQAQAHVQLRRPLAAPRGQARSDLQIMFDLAMHLGLGEHFFDGDIEKAWEFQLEPSGVTLQELRERPGGITLPLETRHRKFAASSNGAPGGFRTATGKVALWSQEFAANGYAPLPRYDEPLTSPRSRPDLAEQFPLVLTCAKSLHFCETQHRNVARLRSRAPDPEVELHPDTAASRGIGKGDWVVIETPLGAVRARASLDANLDPEVVVGQHGWWDSCEELDLPGYAPFGPDSANLNLVLSQGPSDPISGSSPLRASVCNIAPATT